MLGLFKRKKKKTLWPGGHVIIGTKEPAPLDSWMWVYSCKYCGECHEDYGSMDIEDKFSEECPLDE